jgi:catechol 2,3-dioxygenase-like lactoylglutathione lyase family enzyme
MSIGAFSISLNVKDIQASRDFYEKLGFEATSGDMEQNWIVMRNSNATIGLFQGMFPKNMMTFNPGWGRNKEELSSFQDVRSLQESFRSKGLEIIEPADMKTSGPEYFYLEDPDGNPILIDQHL